MILLANPMPGPKKIVMRAQLNPAVSGTTNMAFYFKNSIMSLIFFTIFYALQLFLQLYART
jgi:hypothetical protein